MLLRKNICHLKKVALNERYNKVTVNILSIGQSNMSGGAIAVPFPIRGKDNIYIWGNGAYHPANEFSLLSEPSGNAPFNLCSPNTSIGNAFTQLTGETIYIVNKAESGTGLHVGNLPEHQLWNERGAATLYQESLDACTDANITPDVILFFQGEQDFVNGCSEANYLSDLYDLVSDYRTNYSNASLIFIVAKLNGVGGVEATPIRNAQETFGTDANQYNRRIIIDDLTQQDQTHYDTISLESVGLRYALKYLHYEDNETRTWSGAADSNLNNPANYSGSGPLLPTDDIIFNAGAVAATASADLEINSIVTTAGYSGALSFLNFELTINDGNATFDGTGTLHLGNQINFRGTSRTFHVGAGVGAVTGTACCLSISGGAAPASDFDKVFTIKQLEIENANVVFVVGGASRVGFTNTNGSPLKATFGGTVQFFQGGGATILTRSNPGVIIEADSSLLLEGSSFSITAGTTGVYTCSGFTFQGTAPTYVTVTSIAGDNCIVNFTDDIDLNNSYIRILSSFNFTAGFKSITGTDFKMGTVGGKTITVNHDGTYILGGYDQNTLTAGAGISNLGSSRFEISGNWINNVNSVVNRGLSHIIFTDTASITSANQKFHKIIINATGKTITLIDVLKACCFVKTAGSYSGIVQADEFRTLESTPTRGYPPQKIVITSKGAFCDDMIVKDTNKEGLNFTNISIISETQLVAKIPHGFIGPDIYLKNEGGVEGILKNAFYSFATDDQIEEINNEYRKGKNTLSKIDSVEIARNIADIVDENGIRAHGLLEILSSIQMNTRSLGTFPKAYKTFSGPEAVINKQLIFCPAGSRIVIFDIIFSSLNVSKTTFHDQLGEKLFGSILIPDLNGNSVSKCSCKGIKLKSHRSLFISTTATANWTIEILYALLPTEELFSETITKTPPAIAGVNWIIQSSAEDYEWHSIAFGNGLFVAVAQTGGTDRVMTSTNGITWTIRTAASNNNWISVYFGNNLFVAVAQSGTGNRIMTSSNGIDWTARNSAADNDWHNVSFGNNIFVAVAESGTGNRVMTSPNGIAWIIRTSAADNDWQAVCFGNGLFVAVAETGVGNRVMTSTNGIAWTIRNSAADNDWHSVCFGNGIFVAVAESGVGNRVMTSPDGINWTSRNTPVDNDWHSVTYGNGLFVAVAETGGNDRVMTSPDGINWTIRTAANNNDWNSVAYGNNTFAAVAVSGVGNRAMTSVETF